MAACLSSQMIFLAILSTMAMVETLEGELVMETITPQAQLAEEAVACHSKEV